MLLVVLHFKGQVVHIVLPVTAHFLRTCRTLLVVLTRLSLMTVLLARLENLLSDWLLHKLELTDRLIWLNLLHLKLGTLSLALSPEGENVSRELRLLVIIPSHCLLAGRKRPGEGLGLLFPLIDLVEKSFQLALGGLALGGLWAVNGFHFHRFFTWLETT